MQATLICHPETPCWTLSGITATIVPRRGGCLGVSFRARGQVEAIAWPGGAGRGDGPWDRADELWQHSCFEAFVGPVGEAGYREINAATSGRWAGYSFEAYRDGMAVAEDVAMIAGKWRLLQDRAEMHLLIELPAAYRGAELALGLSAVIEELDGTKSYWALAHPAGKPDFHDRACFALRVPAAKRA